MLFVGIDLNELRGVYFCENTHNSSVVLLVLHIWNKQKNIYLDKKIFHHKCKCDENTIWKNDYTQYDKVQLIDAQ